MTLRDKAWQVPLRLAAGAFVLNSGVSKWDADDAQAKQLQQFAAGVYPMMNEVDPRTFVTALSASEIAIATAVLLPTVSATIAGLGITAFSAGLVGLYWRTPGMHQDNSLRPTEQGISLVKDVWLLAMGASLIVGGLTGRKKRS
ncbi:MAG: hypothetical protein ACRDRL_19285 [Sciscionella sp.]